jgi:hypothetical protein
VLGDESDPPESGLDFGRQVTRKDVVRFDWNEMVFDNLDVRSDFKPCIPDTWGM